MPLYVVATPIGNLEDVTVRAVRVLGEVSVVAAEDTRQTRKLLDHYGIKTPMESYHEHNERSKAPVLVKRLEAGESIALVTDAGTPGISDPGYRLVRLAGQAGVEVVSIPGPSAVAAAISVAGLPTDEFTFKGFVPTGAAKKKKFFLAMKALPEHTFVVYEAPGRLAATLAVCLECMGDVEAAVARELTKVHEEVIRGTVSDIMAAIAGKKVRGEITLVVRSAPLEVVNPAEEARRLVSEGLSVKDAAAAVAAASDISRSEAYRLALRARKALDD